MKNSILTYSIFSLLVFINLYLLWRYRELSMQVEEYNMAVRPIEEQIERIEKTFIGRKVENFALQNQTNHSTSLDALFASVNSRFWQSSPERSVRGVSR